MCGIAGIVDFERAPSAELLGRMTDRLRHRGPDGSGCFLEGPAALGHRRLAIIDLATGDQPMRSEDGRLALVFNGEIYNFRDVRARLEADGRRFRTQSDTEVILRAYEAYGEACVTHLRGMFAFALWDGRRNALFLARDRVGIKPLYYAWDGKRLRFGSELKAILEDPSVDRSLDPTALDDYLTLLYVPAPKSIYRAVRKLPAGHTATVTAGGLSIREYWDLSFEPREDRGEEAHAAEVREALEESVRLHLVSDVPLGAFLSGGIDSSAVVGTMARLMDRPVKTATIGFREAGFDETPYARLAARVFGADAMERTVEASAVGILDSLVWFYDEPFADSSMVPTYTVSQIARERVTVSLSGDGGDENFAGYRRYRFDALENRVRGILPAPLRGPLFGTLGRLYPKADWLPRVFRAKTTLQNLALSPERGYFHTMSWFTPEMKRRLYAPAFAEAIRGYDPFTVFEPHFARSRGWDPVSRVQYVDVKSYLVDDILTKVDRASMAHSLEVRVPLLDHRFMETAAGIPAGHKLRGGEGKRVFKRALEGLVPPDILYRPKMGFTIPLARWLRGELKGAFESTVLASDAAVASWLDPAELRRLWSLHQSGVRDLSPYLWAILVLERWGRRFLRGYA